MTKYVILCLISVVFSSQATAQSHVAKMVCATDVSAKCGKVQPGEGRVELCIQNFLKDFSEPCKIIIARSALLWDACSQDIKKICGDRKSIKHLKNCVKANLQNFNKPCQDGLAPTVVGQNRVGH